MNFDLSNPTTQRQIGSAIRALMLLSPFISTKFDADQITTAAGIVAAAVAFIWGVWQKAHTDAAAHVTTAVAVNKAVAAPESAPQIIADAKAGKF